MPSRLNLLRSFSHLVVAALMCVCLGGPVSGQSLGAVAREAEAQRKTVKSSGKVYTNESLRSEPPPAQPAPAPQAGAAATPPSESGTAPKANEPAKDEAYWRQRIQDEREALARAQTFAAALQSQINGLYAEFTACQAPPQCNEISAKRQKSLAELDRVKQEVDQRTKGVTDIQEEARRAGVPAGWVR
jgi:hypothetical protein